jgi:hypothetical protein
VKIIVNAYQEDDGIRWRWSWYCDLDRHGALNGKWTPKTYATREEAEAAGLADARETLRRVAAELLEVANG